MRFQQCGKCDQQRLRSACVYAQSDQSLCSSLEYSMTVKLLTEHHLVFLSLKGGLVYTCQNATLLEITSHGSFGFLTLSLLAVTYRLLIDNLYKKFGPRLGPTLSVLSGCVAQSVTCLATDASLIADPGVASSIPVPYFRGD